MSRFPEELLVEIKTKVDLVGLVSEHVRLTRRGSSFVGLCPFHQEKTPSFTVVPGKGFFHCFGCGASGSAFNFLMLMDGRSFTESVKELASRTGVELPQLREETPVEELERRRKSEEREWLYKVNELACGFFENNLAGPEGAGARRYLVARGVSPETAREHRLGLALDDWDSLPGFLTRNMVPEKIVESSGLVKSRPSGDGYYNLFRGRLITPITDLYKRIIGFSGRILEGPAVTGGTSVAGAVPGGGSSGSRQGASTSQGGSSALVGPKYLNSPETSVFHKGSVLLGLGVSKEGIRRSESAILVEGNFDLLALWESGFRNVIAPMGTALTTEQASLLARLARTVVLFYDGDNAGRKACLKAIPLLLNAGVRVKMCDLPDGEDPASFVSKNGTEQVEGLIEKAPWALERVLDLFNPGLGSPVEQRAQALRDVSPLISAIPEQIERELYQKRVAELYGVDIRHVLLACRDGSAFRMRGQTRSGVGADAGTGAGTDRGGSEVTATMGGAPIGGASGRGTRSTRFERRSTGLSGDVGGRRAVPDQVEKGLVLLLFRFPEFSADVIKQDILSAIQDMGLAELIRNICMDIGTTGSLDASGFLERLTDRGLKDLAVSLMRESEEMPNDAGSARQLFDDSLHKLGQRRLKQDPLLKEAMRDAHDRGDQEAVKRLLKLRLENARKCLK